MNWGSHLCGYEGFYFPGYIAVHSDDFKLPASCFLVWFTFQPEDEGDMFSLYFA
jgi:hypothetical protein